TVGKHLYFYANPPNHPTFVNSVAVFSNDLTNVGFNAANEAPCGPSVVTTPVVRPKVIPVVHEPSLPETFVSSLFRPRVRVRTPTGWSRRTDTSSTFALASPGGATLAVLVDPRPLSAR